LVNPAVIPVEVKVVEIPVFYKVGSFPPSSGWVFSAKFRLFGLMGVFPQVGRFAVSVS